MVLKSREAERCLQVDVEISCRTADRQGWEEH